MNRQKGSALILVMVVVLVLMLGALAAIRSTETANLVAGNSAFMEATKQSADLGVNAAYTYLIGTVANAPDTAVANKYFPLRQVTDDYGIPSTVDWGQVAETTVHNYKAQYVIERLCTGVLPVVEKASNCVLETQEAAGSNKLGSEVYTSPPTTMYRVTVRTRGPKNSEAYTQVLISR
jgi:type IV pilus assembly protein PilX